MRATAIVGVAPAAEHSRNGRLFEALEQLFPVTFQGRALDDDGGLAALIFPVGTREMALRAGQRGVECFAVLPANGSRPRGEDSWVRFANTRTPAKYLRGQVLQDPHNEGFIPVACESGEEVVASKGGQALWVHRSDSGTEAGVDFVSRPLPVLTDRQCLLDHLNGESFLDLLPLVSFLGRIANGRGWQAPPLRACLVLDDPSLRWRSYGCVNFRELAEHARGWNYHAAIGLIPIDASWADLRTVSCFHQYSDRLSLVIHGNDHSKLEMVQFCAVQERLSIFAQALRRVAELERRYELGVCRVMEAPYGVIGQAMFAPLVAVGFEATLITGLQFLRFNPAGRFPPSFGLQAAECSPGGLAIIPRIKVGPCWKTEVLLAAILGQPIVIAGHHYDAADHLRLLEEIATTMNGLGPVRWCRLSEIARSNYVTRREGNTLLVRAASRRIALPLPEGVDAIQVERPWVNEGEKESLIMEDPGQTGSRKFVSGRVSDFIPVSGRGPVSLISPVRLSIDPASVPAPPRRYWPVVRRALTEARDRAYPFLPRFLRREPLWRQAGSP